MVLEPGAACHSTGAQISANQEKDDGHIEDYDNLKMETKKSGLGYTSCNREHLTIVLLKIGSNLRLIQSARRLVPIKRRTMAT